MKDEVPKTVKAMLQRLKMNNSKVKQEVIQLQRRKEKKLKKEKTKKAGCEIDLQEDARNAIESRLSLHKNSSSTSLADKYLTKDQRAMAHYRAMVILN